MTSFIGCFKKASQLFEADKLDGFKETDNTLYSLLLIGRYEEKKQAYNQEYRPLPDSEIKRLQKLGLKTIQTAKERQSEAVKMQLIDYSAKDNSVKTIAWRLQYYQRRQQLNRTAKALEDNHAPNWQYQTILGLYKDVLGVSQAHYLQQHQKSAIDNSLISQAKIFLNAFLE